MCRYSKSCAVFVESVLWTRVNMVHPEYVYISRFKESRRRLENSAKNPWSNGFPRSVASVAPLSVPHWPTTQRCLDTGRAARGWGQTHDAHVFQNLTDNRLTDRWTTDFIRSQRKRKGGKWERSEKFIIIQRIFYLYDKKRVGAI